MGKRYFWLKLKDDFFSQKEIKMLRRISGGDTFTVIYLKILLLSIRNDGKVYFDGIASNMVEEIALEIDEDVENVQITFNYLQQKGLLVFNSDDEVELSNIHSMIGSETAAASRMRKSRSKKEIEAKRNNVTPQLHHSYTEIEIDIEKDNNVQNAQHSGKNAKALESDFEKLWKLYPNKKGKQVALKAYKRAIKDGVSNKQIQDGIVAYKKYLTANGTEQQYMMHGGTFFNQRSWDDDWSIDTPTSSGFDSYDFEEQQRKVAEQFEQ